MTLYILRHGETDFNRRGIVQGSGVDTDLNELGQQQAQAFYNAYQNIDFQLVVTSKLKRTHQTALPFIARDIPWVQTEDINEISWGEHEGLEGTEERRAVYWQVIEHWKTGNFEAALPGGESAAALNTRVRRFFDWLKTRPEERILVATHGRTLRCMVTMMKDVGPAAMEGMPHANTGCYIVHLREDGQFEFELENDTSHLLKG